MNTGPYNNRAQEGEKIFNDNEQSDERTGKTRFGTQVTEEDTEKYQERITAEEILILVQLSTKMCRSGMVWTRELLKQD